MIANGCLREVLTTFGPSVRYETELRWLTDAGNKEQLKGLVGRLIQFSELEGDARGAKRFRDLRNEVVGQGAVGAPTPEAPAAAEDAADEPAPEPAAPLPGFADFLGEAPEA
jgi:hypothetical protein